MTRAPHFDALVTDPVFPVTFRAFSEGIYGHGVVGIDGLEATAESGDFDVDVDAGFVQYDGGRFEHEAGDTLTVDEPAEEPRWDTVYFDTESEEAGIRAGDPGPTPAPPDIEAGEVLIAYIEVSPQASNITDEDVRNWRARPQPAENAPFEHDDVEGETVYEALGWLNEDKASTPHGNEDHDPNFAEDPHGNESHDPNFSEEGHDHSGEAIQPAEATVDEAPTDDTDVVRKTELDDVEDDVDDLESGQAALEGRVDDAESDIGDLQDQVGMDTMAVDERGDLPDPTGLSRPVLAYIDEEDRYAGVFQE